MNNKLFRTPATNVLECIKRNEIALKGERFCPLSQVEMADDIGISKGTLQRASRALKDEGFIVRKSHSKWALTDKGEKTVAALKRLWATCEEA